MPMPTKTLSTPQPMHPSTKLSFATA
jgi:hypothetical protein